MNNINAKKLLKYLLDQPWHKNCEIIPDYMPKYPGKDTKPKVVIRYNDRTEHPPYLRYSAGPMQGFFWDIYGDNFLEIELAVIALSKAPAPVNVGPITFKLDLDKKN